MLLNEEYLKKVVRESIHKVLTEDEEIGMKQDTLSYHIDNIINGELNTYYGKIDISELEGDEVMEIEIIGQDETHYNMEINCYRYTKYSYEYGDGYNRPFVLWDKVKDDCGISSVQNIVHTDENGENAIEINIDNEDSLELLINFLESKFKY